MYTTKDSGKKAEYESGMQRDTRDGKPYMELLFPEGVPFDEQMLVRLGHLYARGAEKYGARNWEKANTPKELEHYKGSLLDHVIHTITGTEDGEDHAAAVLWNLISLVNTHRNITMKDEVTKEERDAIPDATPLTAPRPMDEYARRKGFNDFAEYNLACIAQGVHRLDAPPVANFTESAAQVAEEITLQTYIFADPRGDGGFTRYPVNALSYAEAEQKFDEYLASKPPKIAVSPRDEFIQAHGYKDYDEYKSTIQAAGQDTRIVQVVTGHPNPKIRNYEQKIYRDGSSVATYCIEGTGEVTDTSPPGTYPVWPKEF